MAGHRLSRDTRTSGLEAMTTCAGSNLCVAPGFRWSGAEFKPVPFRSRRATTGSPSSPSWSAICYRQLAHSGHGLGLGKSPPPSSTTSRLCRCTSRSSPSSLCGPSPSPRGSDWGFELWPRTTPSPPCHWHSGGFGGPAPLRAAAARPLRPTDDKIAETGRPLRRRPLASGGPISPADPIAGLTSADAARGSVAITAAHAGSARAVYVHAWRPLGALVRLPRPRAAARRLHRALRDSVASEVVGVGGAAALQAWLKGAAGRAAGLPEVQEDEPGGSGSVVQGYCRR